MTLHVFDGKDRSREFLDRVRALAVSSGESQVISYSNGKKVTLSATDSFSDAVTKHLIALSNHGETELTKAKTWPVVEETEPTAGS